MRASSSGPAQGRFRSLAARLLVAVLATTAFVVVGSATPAAAYESTIITTMPKDKAIQNRIVELIQQTSDSSSIRFTAFEFADFANNVANPVRTALIEANKRGVTIRGVINDKTWKTTAVVNLWWHFENDFKDPVTKKPRSSIKRCGAKNTDADGKALKYGTANYRGGCFGRYDMHNKFFAFEYLKDGTDNVLLQTSQNLSDKAGGYLAANNAVIFAGLATDSKLWKAYQDYFWDMWGAADNRTVQGANKKYWLTQGLVDEDEAGDVQFFPKQDEPDPLVEIINSVDCKYSGPKDIHMAMNRLEEKGSDPRKVITALRQASKKGCNVYVVTDSDLAPLTSTTRNPSTEAPVKGAYGDKSAWTYVHSKYTLIFGKRNGHPVAYKYTYTGSANATKGSLKGADETMLRPQKVGAFDSETKIYDEFMKNWVLLRDGAAVKKEARAAYEPQRFGLVNPNSEKCVDVSASGTADGTDIRQFTCNNTGAQEWTMTPEVDGYTTFVNTNSGKCMDVAGSSVEPAANIQLWTCNGSWAQQFRVAPLMNEDEEEVQDRYSLVSRVSGQCADVAWASVDDDADIQQYYCNENPAQLWSFRLME